jgi:hypothetical protein
MHASVRALLHEIVDYAGLFPPAKLPLAEALNNYLCYRKESPHRWMLGRFVCPTAQLGELLALAKAHPDGALLRLAALGAQRAQADQFLPAVQADLRAIDEFRQSFPRAIDTFEVAVPKGVPIKNLPVARFLGLLLEADLDGFLEVPRTASWPNDLGDLVNQIDRSTVAVGITTPILGLKLRCGGVTADAFPRDEDVALFIDRCNDPETSPLWKATAGLHHPRRHWDEALQVWHHGFLNVIGGALLARVNRLTDEALIPILADRECEHFRFAEDGFSWKNWMCTTKQIAGSRWWATSFGSCSFTEPVEDLIAMGLLDSGG